MENCEKLTKAGINSDELLRRLMGNASLVRVFIKKFTEDENFTRLEKAFETGDMKAAEMASHTLKGMCGNLAITDLYNMFTEQVNLLRAKEYEKAKAMMDGIRVTYSTSVSTMTDWLADS